MNFFYEHLSDTENFFLLKRFDNCWVNSHFHKSYEFVYVESGRCEVFANDKASVIEAGDMFCVPSHCIHYLKNSGDTEILTMVLADTYFDDFVKDYGSDFFAPTLTDKAKNRKIHEFMTDFYRRYGEHGCDSYLRRKVFIDSFLCLMCDNYEVSPVSIGKHNQNICDILIYIDTHFSEKLSLGMLAEKFNYNRKYFSSYFNKVVGTNITSYINNIRFNNAKFMLDNTDMSVSAVAEKCGFDSLATFYRIMKKYSDKEPKDTDTSRIKENQ